LLAARPGLGAEQIVCETELLGGDDRALAALDVANREPVARLERQHRRRPRLDAVGLAIRVERQQPWDDQSRPDALRGHPTERTPWIQAGRDPPLRCR